MPYDPKTHKYPYPEDTGSHYIILKKNNGAVFDDKYPYVDTSKKMRIKRFFVRLLLHTVVFPVACIRLGLKIEGRENLKKHREELKNGVITVCNHVHFWDFIAVMKALSPAKPYVLAWDKNLRGENAALIRLVGGIPVPVNDAHAAAVMARQVGEMLNGGGWLHVYGEGSMWEFYQPVRPFKNGAAYLACRFDKPVLPLAFSYREPGFIRKKIFRQIALFTLRVGEPLYADKTLPKKERADELTVRSHRAVCRLAGIDPEKNLYPPLYNDSRRVDYY